MACPLPQWLTQVININYQNAQQRRAPKKYRGDFGHTENEGDTPTASEKSFSKQFRAILSADGG